MAIVRQGAIAVALGAAVAAVAMPAIAAPPAKHHVVRKSATPIQVVEPFPDSWGWRHQWTGWFSKPVVGAYGYGIYCRYYDCPPYQPPYIRDAYRGYFDANSPFRGHDW